MSDEQQVGYDYCPYAAFILMGVLVIKHYKTK